jgi:hypothetical protein
VLARVVEVVLLFHQVGGSNSRFFKKKKLAVPCPLPGSVSAVAPRAWVGLCSVDSLRRLVSDGRAGFGGFLAGTMVRVPLLENREGGLSLPGPVFLVIMLYVAWKLYC